MYRRRLARLACLSASMILGTAGLAAAQTGTVPQTSGPDIIVGDLPDVTANAPITVGGVSYCGFAVGTTSCNRGNLAVNWFTGGTDNRHPAISQNLYRYSPTTGRFEQIGQGSLKHGFTALQGDTCNSYFTFGCTPNPAGGVGLGVGCSDPYGSGLNDSPGGMGPRWNVNATTGLFPYPYTASTNSGPPHVRLTELNTSASNARYFIEGQYICGDDAAAGNKNNNASWREVTITPSAGTPPNATAFGIAISGGSGGVVHREQPGVYAWQMIDPSVTITTFDVPDDGRFILACKVTGTGPYTYEYALHNLNSQRCAGSVVIPLPGTQNALTNVGFHDVEVIGEPNQLADPSNPSADDWTVSGAGAGSTSVSWSGPSYSGTPPVYTLDPVTPFKVATFTAGTGIDNTANVLRWATMFNFRFTSEVAPVNTGSIAVGLWRPGTGTAFVMNGVPTPAGATVGALTASCCNGISCSVVTQTSCTGTWGLPGTTCSPNPCINGACCLPSLACSQLNSTNCAAQSGTYEGDGTTCATSACPTPGACCLAAGNCTQSTSPNCTASGGIYHGNNTTCSAALCPTGACCASNGTCSLTASNGCLSGGIYHGDGTTCTASICPTGACCASAGTCSITASNGCTTSGSAYRGDGTTCSTTCPVGACCIGATQTCTSVSSAGCAAQGGGYQGDNTTCTSNPCPFGACCLGCAGCIVTSPSGCTGSGSAYHGNGSTCDAAGCSIENGGFETSNFNGWTTGGNFSITGVFTGTFITFAPHSGTYASEWGAIGTDATIQQTIPAHAGDQVAIGFWYGIAGGGNDDHFLATFDGHTLAQFTNDTGHTAWTQFNTGPFTASADNPVLLFSAHNSPSYDFLDDITVCIQSATAGVCCRGSTCSTSVASATACSGSLAASQTAGAVFTAAGSCNATGNATSPCCYANYNKVNGVNVQDIFDFLSDWFAGSPFANVGGTGAAAALTVQNIFDFLNDWFAGGC